MELASARAMMCAGSIKIIRYRKRVKQCQYIGNKKTKNKFFNL